MLTVGMLWFHDKNLSLIGNIQKAVDYYAKKYDKQPDLVLVHPSMLDGNVHLSLNDKISVRPYRPVLPGHIWIGIEDKS